MHFDIPQRLTENELCTLVAVYAHARLVELELELRFNISNRLVPEPLEVDIDLGSDRRKQEILVLFRVKCHSSLPCCRA